MGRVDDKIAIVTGGGNGIGQAAAEMLAAEGAQVAVTDIDTENGQETADRISEGGGEAIFREHNVASESDWEAVVAATQESFGVPDVLVNNAGIYHIEPLDEMSVEDWRNLMEINVDGVWLGMKYCTPLMKAQGRGSVINLSSVAGLVGVANHACYGASKGAVRTMTKDAAIELASEGVRVNSIHPAYIDTQMADYGAEKQDASKEDLDAMHPIGHMGEPDDVAYAVVYLASEESKFVTGAELVLDGGFTAQ
ncbi:MAG: SDR family NAD(P)-dependent oxidoreductase [Salinibacter sp.]